MEDTQVQGQINNKESTLVDIMSSLCNITNSIKGTEERKLKELEIGIEEIRNYIRQRR